MSSSLGSGSLSSSPARSDDHPRRAEAALEAVAFHEALLHRVEHAAPLEILHRADGPPVGHPPRTVQLFTGCRPAARRRPRSWRRRIPNGCRSARGGRAGGGRAATGAPPRRPGLPVDVHGDVQPRSFRRSRASAAPVRQLADQLPLVVGRTAWFVDGRHPRRRAFRRPRSWSVTVRPRARLRLGRPEVLGTHGGEPGPASVTVSPSSHTRARRRRWPSPRPAARPSRRRSRPGRNGR